MTKNFHSSINLTFTEHNEQQIISNKSNITKQHIPYIATQSLVFFNSNKQNIFGILHNNKSNNKQDKEELPIRVVIDRVPKCKEKETIIRSVIVTENKIINYNDEFNKVQNKQMSNIKIETLPKKLYYNNTFRGSK